LNDTGKGISLSTRVAIEDLMNEFSSRVDEGRGASIHELFIESGRIETPQFVLANREEIRERFTARARDTSRRTRHYWSNARFSGDETEITVVTNVMTMIKLEGDKTIVTGGSSTDVVVQEQGGWAFRSRLLDVVYEAFSYTQMKLPTNSRV
jgi:hypothetical protein